MPLDAPKCCDWSLSIKLCVKWVKGLLKGLNSHLQGQQISKWYFFTPSRSEITSQALKTWLGISGLKKYHMAILSRGGDKPKKPAIVAKNQTIPAPSGRNSYRSILFTIETWYFDHVLAMTISFGGISWVPGGGQPQKNLGTHIYRADNRSNVVLNEFYDKSNGKNGLLRMSATKT